MHDNLLRQTRGFFYVKSHQNFLTISKFVKGHFLKQLILFNEFEMRSSGFSAHRKCVVIVYLSGYIDKLITGRYSVHAGLIYRQTSLS